MDTDGRPPANANQRKETESVRFDNNIDHPQSHGDKVTVGTLCAERKTQHNSNLIRKSLFSIVNEKAVFQTIDQIDLSRGF